MCSFRIAAGEGGAVMLGRARLVLLRDARAALESLRDARAALE